MTDLYIEKLQGYSGLLERLIFRELLDKYLNDGIESLEDLVTAVNLDIVTLNNSLETAGVGK